MTMQATIWYTGQQADTLAQAVTGVTRRTRAADDAGEGLRVPKTRRNATRNTQVIHKTGDKGRVLPTQRLNGIQEVDGSIPFSSTTKNTKGPAKAGPFTLPPPRKIGRGSPKITLVIHVQYTHNTHAYIASMAARSSSSGKWV